MSKGVWLSGLVHVVALAAVVYSVGVSAQTAPSAFEPITVDEVRFNSLKVWLGQQPFNFASPVINTLDQWESEAKTAVQKAWQDCMVSGNLPACGKIGPKE